MPILNELFTNLANKIRSKLGTTSKYTPNQAISAIDDVYNKGVTDTKVGTAAEGHVLTGYTFTNSSGVGLSGTMPNQGKKTSSLNCGGSYTIPAGYHDGTGVITANSLSSQTGVDSGKTAVTAATMLTGYQGWVNGSKITGTMANNGTVSQSLNCGGSYTIPAGYHSGSGKVTANSLASQTSANAGAGQILANYTAWVNGSKITGTMANQGKKTSSLNCGGTYTIPAGYHDGTGVITANSLASQTSATSGAGQILANYTAWVNGSKITGTMANNGTVSQSLNCGGSYTIPAGYHSGSGKVTANSLASQTSATAAAGQILDDYTAWVNGSKITGTMTNRGAVSKTINPGGSYTVPAGYHNGSGKVTANENQNSDTYTFASGSTGSKVDLGVNNTYRYVVATNVYNKGKDDASFSISRLKAGTSTDGCSGTVSGSGTLLIFGAAYVDDNQTPTITVKIGSATKTATADIKNEVGKVAKVWQLSVDDSSYSVKFSSGGSGTLRYMVFYVVWFVK